MRQKNGGVEEEGFKMMVEDSAVTGKIAHGIYTKLGCLAVSLPWTK
jgi:hypothetical protein